MSRFTDRMGGLNQETLRLAKTPLRILTETSFEQEEAYCAYINTMLQRARFPNSQLAFELFTRQYVLDQLAMAIKNDPEMTFGIFLKNCIFQLGAKVSDEIKHKIEPNKNAYYDAAMQLVKMDDTNYVLLLKSAASGESPDVAAIKLSFDDTRAILVCLGKIAEPTRMDIRLLADGVMEMEAFFSGEESPTVVRFSKNDIIDGVVMLYPGSYLIPDELISPLLPSIGAGSVSPEESATLVQKVREYEAQYNRGDRVLLQPDDLTRFVPEDQLFYRPWDKPF